MNDYLKELVDKATYGSSFVRKEATNRLLHECHEWPIEYLKTNQRNDKKMQ